MILKKITTGFVIQDFDSKGKIIRQEFIAGDQVDFEDEKGNEVDYRDVYFPFEMVQPITKRIRGMKNNGEG